MALSKELRMACFCSWHVYFCFWSLVSWHVLAVARTSTGTLHAYEFLSSCLITDWRVLAVCMFDELEPACLRNWNQHVWGTGAGMFEELALACFVVVMVCGFVSLLHVSLILSWFSLCYFSCFPFVHLLGFLFSQVPCYFYVLRIPWLGFNFTTLSAIFVLRSFFPTFHYFPWICLLNSLTCGFCGFCRAQPAGFTSRNLRVLFHIEAEPGRAGPGFGIFYCGSGRANFNCHGYLHFCDNRGPGRAGFVRIRGPGRVVETRFG